MREYVLFQARSRQTYGRWTGLVRVLINWCLRRDLKRLRAMDDYILRDIGIDRVLLERMIRRKLSEDIVWAQNREDVLRNRP